MDGSDWWKIQLFKLRVQGLVLVEVPHMFWGLESSVKHINRRSLDNKYQFSESV